jgi:hypothetical protein
MCISGHVETITDSVTRYSANINGPFSPVKSQGSQVVEEDPEDVAEMNAVFDKTFFPIPANNPRF